MGVGITAINGGRRQGAAVWSPPYQEPAVFLCSLRWLYPHAYHGHVASSQATIVSTRNSRKEEKAVESCTRDQLSLGVIFFFFFLKDYNYAYIIIYILKW